MRKAAIPLRADPAPRTRRPAARLALAGLVAGLLLLTGCGGGQGDGEAGLGTVSLLNQTDLGQAPLVVEAFFLAPVGEADPGENLLAAAVDPGGVVIVGLFPPGTYNAVAVLEGGGQINFPPAEVTPGQPTNFVVP